MKETPVPKINFIPAATVVTMLMSSLAMQSCKSKEESTSQVSHLMTEKTKQRTYAYIRLHEKANATINIRRAALGIKNRHVRNHCLNKLTAYGKHRGLLSEYYSVDYKETAVRKRVHTFTCDFTRKKASPELSDSKRADQIRKTYDLVMEIRSNLTQRGPSHDYVRIENDKTIFGTRSCFNTMKWDHDDQMIENLLVIQEINDGCMVTERIQSYQ
jgi:hypothetical protein